MKKKKGELKGAVMRFSKGASTSPPSLIKNELSRGLVQRFPPYFNAPKIGLYLMYY